MITNKTFDCVDMKHQAAQKVQAHMASMTITERIAYLNQIAADFRANGSIPKVPDATHHAPKDVAE